MARTDEAKWKRIVASVKAGSKGGKAGQWSARKAQLATQRYKASGGGYSGPKTKAQKSLSKWTKEKMGYKIWQKTQHKVSKQQVKGISRRRLERLYQSRSTLLLPERKEQTPKKANSFRPSQKK